jgi:hypothetical protein
VDDDRFGAERFFSGRLYRALEEGRLSIEDRRTSKELNADDLDGLPLPDYHALRDAAIRVGAIAEDAEELTCRNCDAPLPPAPEQAPTEDLDEWYVDGESPDLSPLPLGEDGPEIAFRQTTAGEARAFHRAVLRETFRPTQKVVRAMGIVSLAGERDPAEIARRLETLSDEAWSVFEAAYGAVAYSPKSYFPVVCPRCGALHDMPAPAGREIGGDPFPVLDAPPFVDEERFSERVLAIGEEVYREMGISNVELEVVTSEADVDASGEPLLGSYQPRGSVDEAGIAVAPFLIRIYYRTFARMYEDEPYDLTEELRETIEHELEHHLHHLEGYDPMDEEEQREARAELERTYGKRAVERARMAGAISEAKSLAWLALGSGVVLGLIVLFLYLTGRL